MEDSGARGTAQVSNTFRFVRRPKRMLILVILSTISARTQRIHNNDLQEWDELIGRSEQGIPERAVDICALGVVDSVSRGDILRGSNEHSLVPHTSIIAQIFPLTWTSINTANDKSYLEIS